MRIIVTIFILSLPFPALSQFRAPLDGVSPTLKFDEAIPTIGDGDEKIRAFTVITGLGVHESNNTTNSSKNYGDIDNAQFIIQKPKGELQFYAMTGLYSLPSLGSNYVNSHSNTINSFGYFPLAWITYAPNKEYSLTAGKMLAPGGGELDFTYSNYNIQSGLLSNQTNIISNGVQFNYNNEFINSQFSITDGAYTNTYNWLSAFLNFPMTKTHNISFSWAGAVSSNPTNNYTTSILVNNSNIYNIIYNYDSDHWSFSPYLQYTYTPNSPQIGINGYTGTKGVSLIGTYKVFPKVNGHKPSTNISLPLRFEYINSFGNPNMQDMSLLYGPNSSAWSATFTPTYYIKSFFIRGEASYVRAINPTQGYSFGFNMNLNNQSRVMLETGFMF